MLFSIGNLITLLIVLVFFFIYHRLTSNNRSLEKVKRLAEKLQGELGEYVASREEELKHYGIDLDVQQKAAKIALEKLQSAQETLAEKSEAIGTIAERFREYDDVLSKLMDMTARVDENLKRIHEDETFAEGINRKLELSKKGLAAIERELPLLRESFEQSAQKTIDEFREDILDELQEGLASTAAELNAVKNEAMETFAKAQTARELVDAELEKALDAAASRAVPLEDEAFATLARDIAEKLDALKADIDGRTETLLKDTSRTTDELRSAMTGFRESWTAESQAMLGDLTGRLEEADSIFARKATEIAALLDVSSDRAHAAESSLHSIAETARKDMNNTYERMKALEQTIGNTMEATKTRIEDEFAAFGQAFEDHRTRFEENFMAETKSLEASLGDLKKEIGRLKETAFETAGEKLQGFETALLEELSSKKTGTFRHLDSWLSDMEKTLSGIVTQSSARRDAEEAEYRKEFKSHLVKIRDEMYADLDKLAKEVDSFKSHIQSQAEAAGLLPEESAKDQDAR